MELNNTGISQSEELHVAIIGVGNIGIRHLEALLKLDRIITFYLVDPNLVGVISNIEYYRKLEANMDKEFVLLDSIKKLPQYIDFAIIATNSGQRLHALKSLFQQCDVKYLLLEKFLFPELNHYDEAEKILRSSCTTAYVNCNRRLWDDYQMLRSLFANNNNLTISVVGGNWNMASNAIHFIDLLHFFTTDIEITIDFSNINEAFGSKREGYINFGGSISVTTAMGHKLNLHSLPDHEAGINQIDIQSTIHNCVIYERKGQMIIDGIEHSFKLRNVSELTHLIFASLINTSVCGLIDAETSIKLHKQFLMSLESNTIGRKGMIT